MRYKDRLRNIEDEGNDTEQEQNCDKENEGGRKR